MLARREHSRQELTGKLIRKGCAPAMADAVTRELEAARLLSDARFVESLVRARHARGVGPLRIRQELQDKGVGEELVARGLDVDDELWFASARRARHKRFGVSPPQSPGERAKQARFLQYRGFTFDQIRRALDSDEQDEQ